MNGVRRNGEAIALARLAGCSKNSGPSKADLIKLLDGLHDGDNWVIAEMEEAAEFATKARRSFERRCTEWKKLRRAESKAVSLLRDARDDERRK